MSTTPRRDRPAPSRSVPSRSQASAAPSAGGAAGGAGAGAGCFRRTCPNGKLQPEGTKQTGVGCCVLIYAVFCFLASFTRVRLGTRYFSRRGHAEIADALVGPTTRVGTA